MRSLLLRSSLAATLCSVLISAAPGYRLVEPYPRVSLEVPAEWQEHRRAGDVVYAPPGVDFRSKSLAYGVRVLVEGGETTSVARRLETLMTSYSKANPGLRADGPYLVEPRLNRASVNYTNAPAEDPTVRETGWVLVARLANGRWLGVIAVSPEALKARNGEAFTHVRASLQVLEQ